METTKVKGIGPAIATQLAEIGVHKVADLAKADPKALMAISGIGPSRALILVKEAQDVLGVLPAEQAETPLPAVEVRTVSEDKPKVKKSKKKKKLKKDKAKSEGAEKKKKKKDRAKEKARKLDKKTVKKSAEAKKKKSKKSKKKAKKK